MPVAIANWKQRPTSFRRMPKATWTLFVVSKALCNDVLMEISLLIICLIAMTAAQMSIAQTIDAFYGEAGATDGVSRSYKQAVQDLDAETIKALDGPYRYGWSRESAW